MANSSKGEGLGMWLARVSPFNFLQASLMGLPNLKFSPENSWLPGRNTHRHFMKNCNFLVGATVRLLGLGVGFELGLGLGLTVKF